MTSVVVVGCGFPQLSLVRAAKRRGLRVIGADFNPRAIAVPLCDEFHEVSTSDVEGLSALVGRVRAGAVTTTGSEVSLKATAQVAAQLRLPFYADPETVRLCQDKDAMRSAYAAVGLAVPGFARCATLEEARALAGSRGFPLVVKPAREMCIRDRCRTCPKGRRGGDDAASSRGPPSRRQSLTST